MVSLARMELGSVISLQRAKDDRPLRMALAALMLVEVCAGGFIGIGRQGRGGRGIGWGCRDVIYLQIKEFGILYYALCVNM